MSILETTSQILKLLASQNGSIKTTDVITALNMPKSTASRVMKQLLDFGYLEKDSDSEYYFPGSLIVSVSNTINRENTLNECMYKALRRLCEQTGCTGYISVLDNKEILVLRVIHGRHSLPTVTWAGARAPAWGTSTGRVLLSRLQDKELNDYLNDPLIQSQLAGASQTTESILKVIKQSNTAGYSCVVNESIADTASVSCVISDVVTQDNFAFCLSMPSEIADKEMLDQVITLLKKTKVEIARRMGE